MKKKNFIVLQSEHVDRIKTYPLTTNYYEELIFPIDRIKEVSHLNIYIEDPNTREGYRWKDGYGMAIANSEPSKEDITLYLTEEGYNYVKGVLSSL